MAPTTDGLGLTIAIDRTQYVDELTSAKVTGWSLEDGTGGLMKQTYYVTGSKSTNISSINTNSTVAGAAFPALGNRVMMKQGVKKEMAEEWKKKVEGAGGKVTLK